MKAQLKYRPDLRDCVLEDRFVPVIPNELGDFLLPVVPSLAAIVLTPAGYVLMSSFPGIAIPVSFVVTGSGGISSMQPGNGTGIRRPSRRTDRTGNCDSSARGPTTSSPRSSRWSRATPSPTTPSMPPPSSVVCWGTGPTSCPPSRSIGAACRCPPRAASRRRRPANGPGRIRMRGPSIRCRFGSGADLTASHRATRGLPSRRTRIGRRDPPGTPSPCDSRCRPGVRRSTSAIDAWSEKG